MIIVIAHYRTQPNSAETLRELLVRHSQESESETGCLHFLAHQDLDDPTRFALYEAYENAEAFDAHRRTEHFRTKIEKTLLPLLVEREWHRYGPRL
jgi:quinol monooxygenase YgiN